MSFSLEDFPPTFFIIPRVFHSCYIPTHLILLDLMRVQIMKLLSTYYYPDLCYIFSLRSNSYPQHFSLKHKVRLRSKLKQGAEGKNKWYGFFVRANDGDTWSRAHCDSGFESRSVHNCTPTFFCVGLCRKKKQISALFAVTPIPPHLKQKRLHR
jgi:hypothetical protein